VYALKGRKIKKERYKKQEKQTVNKKPQATPKNDIILIKA
jgi:hypothetical protein